MLGLVHEESQLLVDFVFVLVFEEVLELVDHFVFHFAVFALDLLLHHLLNLVDRLRVDSEPIHAAPRIDVLHALVRIANLSRDFLLEFRAGTDHLDGRRAHLSYMTIHSLTDSFVRSCRNRR